MYALPRAIAFTMPEWFDELPAELPDCLVEIDERMALVNALARRNFEAGTGGPFAAGVFERDSGRIVGLGVNRVVPLGYSGAHAEFMAVTIAQHRLGTYDLGARGLPAHQLVVNWRPCAMCFGSVVWSGVVDLVIAGAGEPVEALTGFDEGPIHPEWEQQLLERGIKVTIGVGYDEAVATFRAYGESGQVPYNSRGARKRA